MTSFIESLLYRIFTQRSFSLNEFSLSALKVGNEGVLTEIRRYAKSRFLNSHEFDAFLIKIDLLTQVVQDLHHRVGGLER